MERRREKQYSEAALVEAVALCKAKKISLSQASIRYNIPKGTLHNKIYGKTAINCKKGPKTILSSEEELKLSSWILNMAKVGYPVNTEYVRETVEKMLEMKGVTNWKPGMKWMKLFLRRHPEISKRHAEIISKARASITEPMIRRWFNELQQYLQEEKVEELLEQPDRIFNLDETGVQLCPKIGVILGPKNYRAMYDVATAQEKQSITVLCNFSASGERVPPFVVYPLQRISKEIAQSVPDDWGIGRSESGWMTGPTFFEYIKEIFLPWLVKYNVCKPVLLLVDGHKSHINMDLHDFCVQNQIILYCLLPNTTHILQPCDVGIFGPLKSAWKNAVRQHKLKENVQITRSNFAKVFSKPFQNTISRTTIQNAFKACGIFPFCPDAVDYTKCISNRREEIEEYVPLQDYITTINVIEKSITKRTLEKYDEYRHSNKNFKSSLFKFWSKCKKKVNNTSMLSKSSNINDSTVSFSNMIPANTEKRGEEEFSLTIGTDVIVDGLLDIENLPIDLEGVSLLLNDNNNLVEESHLTPLSPTQSIDAIPRTSFMEDVVTSTPISTAIPLPWYSEKQYTMKEPSPIGDQFSTNTSKISKIDELLRLPESKKNIKRKFSQVPMPLAITSKKFKEYLKDKDDQKKKKEEEVMKRKLMRAQKKEEKDKAIKSKPTDTKFKPKQQIDKTTSNTENEAYIKKVENDINFQFGSIQHVVVEFKTNKRNRFYVGKVTTQNFEKQCLKVSCLRKKCSKLDNFIYFVEPPIVDLTEVPTTSVKHVLPSPEIGRRGMITFKNFTQFDLSMCE